MESRNRYEMIYAKRLLALAAGIIILITAYGCSGNYGRLAANHAVKKQIENYQVLDDYNYYYSGSFANPRVVIGIQKDYQLVSDLWLPVALTSQQLKQWVDPFSPGVNIDFGNGSDILTPKGKKIGVWYSFKDRRDWALVEIIDSNKVKIGVPIGHKGDWDDGGDYKRKPLGD